MQLEVKLATGDPRNMAFMLHWDGFGLKEGQGGYSTGRSS